MCIRDSADTRRPGTAGRLRAAAAAGPAGSTAVPRLGLHGGGGLAGHRGAGPSGVHAAGGHTGLRDRDPAHPGAYRAGDGSGGTAGHPGEALRRLAGLLAPFAAEGGLPGVLLRPRAGHGRAWHREDRGRAASGQAPARAPAGRRPHPAHDVHQRARQRPPFGSGVPGGGSGAARAGRHLHRGRLRGPGRRGGSGRGDAAAADEQRGGQPLGQGRQGDGLHGQRAVPGAGVPACRPGPGHRQPGRVRGG